MTFLSIGGLVCLGFVVVLVIGVIAFLIYAVADDKATNKRVRENGKPVLGTLVMINEEFLNNPNAGMSPGLMLFAFDPPSKALAKDMREIATQLFKLYKADTNQIVRLSEPLQQTAERLKDHDYQTNRRTRVVSELSRGHDLYLADTYVDRDRVPDHALRTRLLACMVTGQDEGEIIVLPPDDEEAQRIYQALGIQ